MLKYVKSLVGIFLMLLGLSGMVDNIVEWHGFIAGFVSHYQTARDILFGMLPFELSSFAKDYLVIGLVVVSSYGRAVEEQYFKKVSEHTPFPKVFTKFFVSISVLLALPLWPIILLGIISRLPHFNTTDEHYVTRSDKIYLKAEEAQSAIKHLAWAIVLFIGALFLFSDALSKFTGN